MKKVELTPKQIEAIMKDTTKEKQAQEQDEKVFTIMIDTLSADYPLKETREILEALKKNFPESYSKWRKDILRKLDAVSSR